MQTQPRVSVVTPFYNTAAHLAPCIESVLAQTYTNFEYLLVNNKSTDGSRDIAARYAACDTRIKLFDNPVFVDQLTNYNESLARIGADVAYVKIVQADDLVLPECLARLVEVAEREPGVCIVSSYYLDGDDVTGARVPYDISRIPGREASRKMLLEGPFLVGTPTTLLYRADAVRARPAFYTVGRYHPDTEAAHELLRSGDLGFVHQVLSVNRKDDASITGLRQSYNPNALDHLMMVERYGEGVLDGEELQRLRNHARDTYLRYLGRSVLARRGKGFWDYHRRGLATIGWKLRRRELVRPAVGEVVRMALDPRTSIERALGTAHNRTRRETPAVATQHTDRSKWRARCR